MPTVRHAIRLVEHDGWELVRIRGSHRQFKHPVKRGRVTIAGPPKQARPDRSLAQYPETGRAERTAKLMAYVVVIEKAPENYGAYVPDLPGCVSVGDTFAEMLSMIEEAIEFHLDGIREDGEPIPPPTTTLEQAMQEHVELIREYGASELETASPAPGGD